MEATECVSPSCSSKQKAGLLRKMLKCLHVVCVPCLRQGLDFNGSFRCPQTDCSSLTKGKGVGLALIDTLPDAPRQHGSTATQTSSVDAREMASVWPPACEDCIDQEIAEPETTAGQCTVCARLLCVLHSGLHSKRKQFSGHSVMELEKSGLSDSGIDTVSSPSEDESRTPALPSTRQGRHYRASLSPCPHHQGSPVQLYCTNCDAYLCEVCETSARCREESHVVQEFAEAAEPLLTDLCTKFGVVPSRTATQPPPQADSGASAKEEGGDPSTISRGNQVTNADQSSVRTRAVAQEPSTSLGHQLVEAIAAVEEELSGMQSHSEKLSEKVTKHFNTLRERLQARERQLLDQLGSLHNKKAAPVEQRSIKLKSALDSFSRASCYLSALESSELQENSLSLLRSSQWLHEIYSSSAGVYENCRVGNHCHGLKLEFDPEHQPLDIEATGHVRDATVHPDQCEVLCIPIVSTGKPFQIKVQAHGSDGKPTELNPEYQQHWQVDVTSSMPVNNDRLPASSAVLPVSKSARRTSKQLEKAAEKKSIMEATVAVPHAGAFNVMVSICGRQLTPTTISAFHPITWISERRCYPAAPSQEQSQYRFEGTLSDAPGDDTVLLRAHQKFKSGMHRWVVEATRSATSSTWMTPPACATLAVETDSQTRYIPITKPFYNQFASVTLDCEAGVIVVDMISAPDETQQPRMLRQSQQVSIASQDGYMPIVLGSGGMKAGDSLTISSIDPLQFKDLVQAPA